MGSNRSDSNEMLLEAITIISRGNYKQMLEAIPIGVSYGGINFNKPEHFAYGERIVDQGFIKIDVDNDMVDYAKLLLTRNYANYIYNKYYNDIAEELEAMHLYMQ
jgi:hypothetical protein